MKFLPLIFLLSLSSAIGQLNIEHLSTTNYPTRGNDVWGYTAPDSQEYAILGVLDGVAIVNVTDPRNPVEVDFIPQTNSIWRDMKTWGTHAYAVADQRGTRDGILIIDLEHLPDSISYRNVNPTIDSSVIQHCHNIYIDEFGIAYLAGCNSETGRINDGGVLMYDVVTTPGEPELVGVCPEVYSHDV